MNFIGKEMSFDGVIGDLGSTGKVPTVSTIKITGSGEEKKFIERCRNRFIGKEIISEDIITKRDGRLEYIAKVKSYDGI